MSQDQQQKSEVSVWKIMGTITDATTLLSRLKRTQHFDDKDRKSCEQIQQELERVEEFCYKFLKRE